MTSRQKSDEMFEMAGNDPSSWLQQAQWLKTSSDILYDQLRLTQQTNTGLTTSQRSDALLAGMQSYLMLAGFCLENLIKGIQISRNAKLVTQERVDPSLLKHDVINLLPIDILLSEHERKLLGRLQRYAIWAGRYPIPTKSHDFHKAQGELTLTHSDKLLIDSLFLRLSIEIGSITKSVLIP